MKVAYHSPINLFFPFVGDTLGGSHISALLLTEALPRDQFMPVIVLHRRGALSTYLDERGIAYMLNADMKPVQSGSVFKQITAMLVTAPRLARFVRAQNAHIVHTNDAKMHLTWALACCLAGCKHVWHQRSADNSRRLSLFAKLASAVVTISNHCKFSLHSTISDRARVIYDPFDTEAAVHDKNRARVMIRKTCDARPNKTTVVGFVGNLTKQKRPIVFVDTAAILASELGDSSIYIMVGELRADVHEQVKERIAFHGLQDQIHLLGPQYPIEPWIAGMDVLAAPAINEGLGRTIVEAALVGTPVVASDDGGHREIIEHGETGRLVPLDDPDSMAANIVLLLSEPSRAQAMVERAAKQVRKRFSVNQHVKQISELYQALTS